MSPSRSNILHNLGQMPLVDNNGHSSAGFDVMCRQAALRRPRAMHPQMIVRRRPTLWPAPSQMERRSQAARRRLRRRAVTFRLGVRAALEGPPGLAKYETLVNAEEQETTTIGNAPLEDVPDETEAITFGEQEDEPDRPDVTTFEEQDTRSLLRPEDEDPRSLLRPVPPKETRDGDPVHELSPSKQKNFPILTEKYLELMENRFEFEWNIFPGLASLEILQKIQEGLQDRNIEPEKYEDPSSCQCSMTSNGHREEILRNLFQIPNKSRSMLRDSREDTGHSSALETKRSGTELSAIHLKENGIPQLRRWWNDRASVL